MSYRVVEKTQEGTKKEKKRTPYRSRRRGPLAPSPFVFFLCLFVFFVAIPLLLSPSLARRTGMGTWWYYPIWEVRRAHRARPHRLPRLARRHPRRGSDRRSVAALLPG